MPTLSVLLLALFVVMGCGPSDATTAAAETGNAELPDSAELCLALEEAIASGRVVEQKQHLVLFGAEPDPGTVQGYVDALRDTAAALENVAKYIDESLHPPLMASIDTHMAAADLVAGANSARLGDDDFAAEWAEVMSSHTRDEDDMAALNGLVEALLDACPDADPYFLDPVSRFGQS